MTAPAVPAAQLSADDCDRLMNQAWGWVGREAQLNRGHLLADDFHELVRYVYAAASAGEPVAGMIPTKRDGDWLDDMGCCKLCDGEIPDGHTSNCYLGKLALEKLANWRAAPLPGAAGQAVPSTPYTIVEDDFLRAPLDPTGKRSEGPCDECPDTRVCAFTGCRMAHVDGKWCANLHCSKCYAAGTWQKSELAAAEARAANATELLRMALCPDPDCKDGSIAVQISDRDWSQQQCQWCDERQTLLAGATQAQQERGR